MIDVNVPKVPHFLSSVPSKGAIQVKEDSAITLKFSQPVKLGAGYIFINKLALNSFSTDLRSISVQDASQAWINPDNPSEVIIKPSAELLHNASYYVQFADGVFTDTDGHLVKGISDTFTIDFKTAPPDTSPPVAVSTVPSDNAVSVAIDSTLMITFNEPIQAGPGRFMIDNGQGDTRLVSAYDSSQVFIYGNTVTLTPHKTLLMDSHYRVLMQDAAVLDMKGNAVVGIINDHELHFTTAPPDTTPPVPINSSPSVNAERVSVSDLIIAEFDEPVRAGTGSITISNGLDDIQTIPVTDGRFITVGNGKNNSARITITPTKPLQAGSQYFVQVDAGAIVDFAGNAYSGIQDHSFIFKTTPSDNISPDIVNFSKNDDRIFIEFNERIKAGSGKITIADPYGNSHTIDSHDTSVSIFGNMLTIAPFTNYRPDTVYSVLMDKGFVTDLTGNAFPGINDNSRLVFSTPPIDTFPPIPVSAKIYGLNEQGQAPLQPTIRIQFDEPVKPGPGYFIISNGQNDVRKISATDGNQITIGILDNQSKTDDYRLLEITPSRPLLAESHYFLLMETGAVTDNLNHGNDYVMDPQAFTFNTLPPDTAPPKLQSSFPADDVFLPPYRQSFTLYFDESIKANSGRIILSNERNDTRILNIKDTSQVKFDGSLLKIDIDNPLLIADSYAIHIDPGAITDLNGNSFAGITDKHRYNFFIKADTDAPKLISSDPFSYSTIPTSIGFTLTFNEHIKIGSGNITLINDKGDKRILSVKNISQVMTSNSSKEGEKQEGYLHITPFNALMSNSQYVVLIDEGVVTDLSGNAFEGVNDTKRLVFNIMSN